MTRVIVYVCDACQASVKTQASAGAPTEAGQLWRLAYDFEVCMACSIAARQYLVSRASEQGATSGA